MGQQLVEYKNKQQRVDNGSTSGQSRVECQNKKQRVYTRYATGQQRVEYKNKKQQVDNGSTTGRIQNKQETTGRRRVNSGSNTKTRNKQKQKQRCVQRAQVEYKKNEIGCKKISNYAHNLEAAHHQKTGRQQMSDREVGVVHCL